MFAGGRLSAEQLAAYQRKYPGHVTVSYINCSAAVKAMSDCIVTSSNAERILRSHPADQPILFAPDQHLRRYLAKKTGGTNMVVYPGRVRCTRYLVSASCTGSSSIILRRTSRPPRV